MYSKVRHFTSAFAQQSLRVVDINTIKTETKAHKATKFNACHSALILKTIERARAVRIQTHVKVKGNLCSPQNYTIYSENVTR